MKKATSGFTLVELLIVIVVIAVLAAISIVAYNGIQDRARTVSGQTLANQTNKAAEVYNVLYGSYPTLAELTTGSYAQETSLPSGSIKQGTTSNRSSKSLYESGKAALYQRCSSTSALAVYWDYVADSYVEVAIGEPCIL